MWKLAALGNSARTRAGVCFTAKRGTRPYRSRSGVHLIFTPRERLERESMTNANDGYRVGRAEREKVVINKSGDVTFLR